MEPGLGQTKVTRKQKIQVNRSYEVEKDMSFQQIFLEFLL